MGSCSVAGLGISVGGVSAIRWEWVGGGTDRFYEVEVVDVLLFFVCYFADDAEGWCSAV